MTNPTAAALLHNTATRVTLGNTPLHAVPVTVAQQLRPLLESNTSLTAFTVHMQFTPPESLRLLLLGASRCRSLQHVRLVGGISVLQSKMMMAAFANFTFARTQSRAPSPSKTPAGRRPHTPPPRAHRAAGDVPDACRPSGAECCTGGGYARLHSPPLRFSWLNGVHVVLDLHHLDDVVAGFLVKGLERSERIVGLDLHIAPTSQAVTRAAGRMLSHTNPIIARNSQRVRYLLSRDIPRCHVTAVKGAEKKDSVTTLLPCSPNADDNGVGCDVGGEQRERHNEREDMFLGGGGGMGVDVPIGHELSTSDSPILPLRRYTPPRLLSGAPPPPGPLSRPVQQHVANARLRLFCKSETEMGPPPRCERRKEIEEEGERESKEEGGDVEDTHGNDCFVCFGEALYTPERRRGAKDVVLGAMNEGRDRTRGGSSVEPTLKGHHHTETARVSPAIMSRTPCSPPSPRGQLVQHMRYLRMCVRDINAVVVRYQVASQDSVRKLVAEMRVHEEHLAEKMTANLTDILMSLSEMEKKVE